MEADETCSCIVFGDENVHQPCFQAQDVRVCQACAECCFVPGVGGVTQRVSETKAFACECRHLPGGHFCLFAAASPCPELKNVLRPKLLTIFQDTVGKKHVMGTISAHLEIARVFDNEEAQQEAMELLPPEILQIAYPDSGERDDLKLFSALLAWFKTFFSWVGQAGLTCGVCGSNKTRVIGGTFPTAEEQKWRVGNVEVFACDDCKQHTRFPRFNNARKLLQTRRGRCGEYAQAFSLICASLQYSTRLVVDLTDHVWTEVKIGKKWLHADTGESSLDKPLLYEAGWGKQLTYCFAVRSCEAVDVTRRYTNSWAAVLARRVLCPEPWLASQLALLRQDLVRQQGLSLDQSSQLQREQEEEQQILANGQREVEQGELVGRITGDAAWHKDRGERTGN